MAMGLTKAGLPNTCSVCAKTVTKDEGWYAENEDTARAGGGVCADHVSVPPHAEPADADAAKAEAKQAKADAKAEAKAADEKASAPARRGSR